MEADEAERSAYHEAGHFVVWHVLPCRALEIRGLTIAETARHAGRLAAETGEILRPRDLEDICVVLLAGYAAETRLVGRPTPSHARTDLAQVTRIIRQLRGGEAPAQASLRKELHGRCAAALERHWASVCRLAAALCVHETLSRDAALALL